MMEGMAGDQAAAVSRAQDEEVKSYNRSVIDHAKSTKGKKEIEEAK